MDDYVTKPICRDELSAALERRLAHEVGMARHADLTRED
jgi:CheY-like chemotaxis protein